MYSLQRLELPDTLTFIGSQAFEYAGNSKSRGFAQEKFGTDPDAPGIETLVIPDSVTTIEKEAFMCCNTIKSVKLSSNLTEIPESCFSHCTSLESVEIPSSITKLGQHAFFNNEKITELVIPDTVTELDDGALSNMHGLKSVTISKNVTEIKNGAFVECNLREVIIPDGVTRIGYHAFAYNENLTKLLIPASVTEIDEKIVERSHNAFIWCYENSTAHKYAQTNNIPFELIKDAPPAASFIYGDVDRDGYITAVDAASILRCSILLEEYDDETKKIGNVDEDSDITANDALSVLRFSIGMNEQTLVGKNG